MNKFDVYTYGPCITVFQVDDDLRKRLLDEGNKSREKNLDFRNELAGNIESEFYYENYDWFVSDFAKYVDYYSQSLVTHLRGQAITSWRLDKLWINYMKANEYNPPHSHNGDLSFVIYLDVPKEIEQEKNEHTHAGAGVIAFDFGQQMPLSIARIAYSPSTSDAIIFPSWLKHHVHSFKSPVERISVSGNIFL